ncbi:polysaccharide pyruvyl transferase family protein [Neobacillus sp. OS1-2]|uniref:polysaccharide pyruvyl transferase family protein n=1 Tax=Neobacillus sp. OS1-2 TaxID=3070680 RepID=UPI0027DEB739|nr:polysaccharide pyruvyl transferase family protein [Neobacillus sp. OS1-2]WML39499.1 polysaccharide pyruvyl transferase family protein [Neobacillus sp. OS1-2]
MRLLYLGYLGFNNIGDEVCYEAFLQAMNEWSPKPHTISTFPLSSGKSLKDFYNESPFDAVILGGGSLLQGNLFLTLAEEAIQMRIPLYCYGTGIDYLSEEAIASYSDQNKYTPHSFFNNREIDQDRIKHVIEKATYSGLRGPITNWFINGLAPDTVHYSIIGDPGLIFNPPVDHYIRDNYFLDLNRKMVAVNWGTTYNRLFGSDESALKLQLIESCNYLISKGYHIVIFPMWDKDLIYCKELYESINNRKEVTLINEICTATQIFHFLAGCHFSINLKLHANILSAASLTPFIQLAYRSKGFDFAASINQLDNTVSTSIPSLVNYIKMKEETIHTQQAITILKEEKMNVQKEHQSFIMRFF